MDFLPGLWGKSFLIFPTMSKFNCRQQNLELALANPSADQWFGYAIDGRKNADATQLQRLLIRLDGMAANMVSFLTAKA